MQHFVISYILPVPCCECTKCQASVILFFCNSVQSQHTSYISENFAFLNWPTLTFFIFCLPKLLNIICFSLLSMLLLDLLLLLLLLLTLVFGWWNCWNEVLAVLHLCLKRDTTVNNMLNKGDNWVEHGCGKNIFSSLEY